MKRIHSRKHSACCSTASTVHPYTWPAKAHKAMQYNPPPNTNHYKNSLQCEQHEQSTCFCTSLPTRHAEKSTITNNPTNYNSANTVAADTVCSALPSPHPRTCQLQQKAAARQPSCSCAAQPTAKSVHTVAHITSGNRPHGGQHRLLPRTGYPLHVLKVKVT